MASSFTSFVLQAGPGHSVTKTTTTQGPLLLATHSKRALSRQVRTQLFSMRGPSSTERAMVVFGTCSQAATPATDTAIRMKVLRAALTFMGQGLAGGEAKLWGGPCARHRTATKPGSGATKPGNLWTAL